MFKNMENIKLVKTEKKETIWCQNQISTVHTTKFL